MSERSLWLVDWKVLRDYVDVWDPSTGFDAAHAKDVGQVLRADAIVLVQVRESASGVHLAAALLRPTLTSTPRHLAEVEGADIAVAAAALAGRLVEQRDLYVRVWNCSVGGPCRLTTR